MSVLDYTKDLQLFDGYQLKIMQMLIDEMKLKQNNMFSFLNQIDLQKLEFYWYSDSKEDVLGGFHLPSQNVIYINRNYYSPIQDKRVYTLKMDRMLSAFPVIMHEIYHYYQYKSLSLLYVLLQLPIIRDYTIQIMAYKISDYLYDNNIFINFPIKEIVKLKQKHKFSKLYFDEIQKPYMS